jgi:hypothetical protein
MNVRLTNTEMMLAEPSADTEPFELGARDHELLRKAVQHYQLHLDQLSRDNKYFGCATTPALSIARNNIDALHDKIIRAHVITITPDE